MYILVFAIGRPIGMTVGIFSAGQVHSVTSTAASVGPYKLYKLVWGRRSLKCRARMDGSASPLHITRVRLEHCSACECSRNACNIGGTKCNVVIWFPRIVSAR